MLRQALSVSEMASQRYVESSRQLICVSSRVKSQRSTCEHAEAAERHKKRNEAHAHGLVM